MVHRVAAYGRQHRLRTPCHGVPELCSQMFEFLLLVMHWLCGGVFRRRCTGVTVYRGLGTSCSMLHLTGPRAMCSLENLETGVGHRSLWRRASTSSRRNCSHCGLVWVCALHVSWACVCRWCTLKCRQARVFPERAICLHALLHVMLSTDSSSSEHRDVYSCVVTTRA